MGFFDFLKKKPQEQPVVEQTEEKDVVEIAGIEVNTTPEKEEDIVLNVNENLGTTTAINQAVHEVMDEEEIEFHEKAGGTLYQENDDIAAAEEEPEVEIELTTEETVVPEDAEAFTEELTELVEEGLEAAAESERELQVETAEEKFVEETDAEGQQFVEELADFVVEELEAEQEAEEAEEETAEEAETEPVSEEIPAQEPVKEKKGFFARLKEGLDKTRKNILGGVDTVLGSFTKIDEDLFEELEEALIMADMGVQTTMDIVENLRQRVKKERATDPAVIKDMLIDEITAILQDGVEEEENLPSPTVMLVIGVNGVGKTTTIGKLSHNFKNEGKSVLLAAADTFRAAAIDQLEVWGQRAGIEVIKHEENADPAAVVFDAVHAARNRKTDLLICDTAGRLHNKKNLMEELRKISRVIEREYPAAHKETYLVLDATTGQNALQQAKVFMEVADITGIILTKLDGTAKGGIVVAIKSELKIPVRYIGVGEGIEDLQKFHAEDFAKALFGEEA
ncbi:signal recognition particle-docking protein FtsY [Anaerotignum lactatifermentans]|uniref:Signal recognition particle receptor FtsY n=2 Tax=Anaerotignum TaxID=2039240 RepID=A0A1Y3U0C0_9FIRM|nr:signal recognition particle-docking protein FtsY [Anaerotignum lactatifermentans]OUN42203.1 signal recognition particle-docking protein FtsY [Anaerotignum lactatifermentans]